MCHSRCDDVINVSEKWWLPHAFPLAGQPWHYSPRYWPPPSPSTPVQGPATVPDHGRYTVPSGISCLSRPACLRTQNASIWGRPHLLHNAVQSGQTLRYSLGLTVDKIFHMLKWMVFISGNRNRFWDRLYSFLHQWLPNMPPREGYPASACKRETILPVIHDEVS